MYNILTREQYKGMTTEGRVAELKKWIEEELGHYKNTIRSIAMTNVDDFNDIGTIIDCPYEQLATHINDYEEGTACHFVLKYRLDHAIENCDDTITDTDEYGKLSLSIAQEYEEDENQDYLDLKDIRGFIIDLITLCTIFGFEDLQTSLKAWCPE